MLDETDNVFTNSYCSVPLCRVDSHGTDIGTELIFLSNEYKILKENTNVLEENSKIIDDVLNYAKKFMPSKSDSFEKVGTYLTNVYENLIVPFAKVDFYFKYSKRKIE